MDVLALAMVLFFFVGQKSSSFALYLLRLQKHLESVIAVKLEQI
jgi:hypothetical protein